MGWRPLSSAAGWAGAVQVGPAPSIPPRSRHMYPSGSETMRERYPSTTRTTPLSRLWHACVSGGAAGAPRGGRARRCECRLLISASSSLVSVINWPASLSVVPHAFTARRAPPYFICPYSSTPRLVHIYASWLPTGRRANELVTLTCHRLVVQNACTHLHLNIQDHIRTSRRCDSSARRRRRVQRCDAVQLHDSFPTHPRLVRC